MTDTVAVTELGHTIEFTFDDVLKYHGPGSPAGVAIGFKAMQCAFAVLVPADPPRRSAVTVRTPFRGPGARDCFEAVTRAVTSDRYVVDRTLLRADRGRLLEDFVFEIAIEGATVTLLLRDGFVTDEFIDLARTEDRTDTQEARLVDLKAQLARRVLSASSDELFDIA
jgi:hypothetical protein